MTLEPPYGDRDAGDMGSRIDAIPEHIDAALARTDAEPWSPPAGPFDAVAFGGMGGSAIAGELTAAMFADQLPRPFVVVRDDHWPAWVSSRTLAVLSSNSGNTEETLALESEARARGVPRVALTSGGELAQRSRANGTRTLELPAGMPPRAALFHAWVAVSRLPVALGWAPDPAPEWREAAVLLRSARDERLGRSIPEARNPAKQLARALAGRRLIVYSAGAGPGAVGVRWRQQFNENAKLLGHSAVVPELNHNEIVGWQHLGPVRQAIAVLVLRDRDDSDSAKRRLDLTAEYATRQGALVHEIHSIGDSRVARLASLVQFGDCLSFHLALLGGVDPTDIASIDEFKRRLAESSSARAR